MAFNPFVTFQKNRRFWMAAILMICMVSFVFCTGLKGDMAERIQWMFGGRGASAFTLDGRTYTVPQLHELRKQRNLANKLMMNSTEMAFRKLSKEMFDMSKQPDGGKPDEAKARRDRLLQIQHILKNLGHRKSRPRYFDIGIKFDDLVEFTAWQAVADKLGIQLDDNHVDMLYYNEFFVEFRTLNLQELDLAEQQTRREFQDVGHAFVRRAITEEFRVRIAQEAYLLAQPLAFFAGARQAGLSPRLTDPEMPVQVRAPLTVAQLWDEFKKNRAEYDVTLLPISVDEFVKKIKDMPSEADKEKFYKENKDKQNDPSSDVRGLQVPQRIKIEFLYADPSSPAYLETAKLIDRLKSTSLFAPEATFSPLAAATRAVATDKLHHKELEAQYDAISRPTDKFYYLTSPSGAQDFTTPLLMWLAKRNWEAVASLSANSAPTIPDAIGSVATFMAWGALKHPEDLEISLRAEAKRRAPLFASMVAGAIADPSTALSADFALNYMQTMTGGLATRHQQFPVEVAYRELEDMRARRAAESKAQANMQVARAALEKAGSGSAEFKRELNRLVPEMKLTYGPAADKKDIYHNRYTVNEAKELDPLRDVFLRYVDAINMFEARDLTPEKLLKPTDFHRMFFDGEPFAAAAPYRAMAWPPVLTKPSNQRVFGMDNPRLIDPRKIGPALEEQYRQHIAQNDPLRPLPAFEGLFKNAEKPILYWRTAKRDPIPLPAEYSKIDAAIKKKDDDVKMIEQQIKKQAEIAPKLDELRKKRAELLKAKSDVKALTEEINQLSKSLKKLEQEAKGSVSVLRERQADLLEEKTDLIDVQKAVVEGWKFERARSAQALPTAKSVADTLLKNGNRGILTEAAKLGASTFSISRLSRMFPEEGANSALDYGKPPLPRDKIAFARDDMIDQALSLYDLAEPIKTGNKELDDVNKELFERVHKQPNARGNYVQILTNKPRSTFYVALVELPPQASKDQFIRALRLASPPEQDADAMARRRDFQGVVRDRFVERIQQQVGQRYRYDRPDGLVESLKRSMNFSIDNDKAKTEFDDKVVGD